MGRKKGNHALNGSVVFDSEKGAVDFLDQKGNSILSIPNDKITNPMHLEPKPRLIGPPYQYLLTIRYTDDKGIEKSVAITLGQRNLREVMLAASAETGKEVFHEGGCCGVP